MSGKIRGRVFDSKGSNGPVGHVRVYCYDHKPGKDSKGSASVLTDSDGQFEFCDLAPGTHYIQCSALGHSAGSDEITVEEGKASSCDLGLEIGASITTLRYTGNGEELEPSSRAVAGKRYLARVEGSKALHSRIHRYDFMASPAGSVNQTSTLNEAEVMSLEAGPQQIEVMLHDKIVDSESKGRAVLKITASVFNAEADRQMIAGDIAVRLNRPHVHPTRDQALWVAIRNRTFAIGFNRYRHFINRVLQAEENAKLDNSALEARLRDLGTHLHGVGAYEVLRLATEAFLLLECGVRIEEGRGNHENLFHRDSELARLGGPVSFDFARAKLQEYLGSPPQLPYITRVIQAAFPEWQAGTVCCDRVLTAQVNEPCLIELIWSYWNEEGMLAQTMNAISRRFQNVHAPGDRDPLAHLEIDPLRPLNNLVWGFIQDDYKRLTVKRRAYEYEHQYGLSLYGRAVKGARPADSRSKFLEGFHNLLHLCSVFFKEDNDTTVIADGYPLLNALKEVHLLLAQGAHNQFGDMAWTARAEMMLQQWIVARPEIRDFLQSRAMVPYKEPWMPQVDTMKSMQGWTDVTVTHFRDLAVYGEQILLSVRYGDWIAVNDEDSAKNWARYWRPEIQGYLHAYRAATGIDLTNPDTVDARVPALHLQKRLIVQQQRAR